MMLVIALAGAVMAGIVLAHGQGDQQGQGGMGDRPMMGGQGMMGSHGMMGGQGMMDGQGMMGGHGMMGGQGMMGDHGMMGPYVSGVLELTGEQRERIEAIQQDKARAHWRIMQEMHERGQAMMALRAEPDPDPEALGRAHERWSESQREMLVLRARMQREMREVLTSEQRARLDEMRQWGQQQ